MLRARFKSESRLIMDQVNNTIKRFEKMIKEAELKIDFMKSCMAKQLAVAKHFTEKESSILKSIESLSRLAEQALKMKDESAAKNYIREKINEQNKLLELQSIRKRHHQNTETLQKSLRKTIFDLDNMIVQKETLQSRYMMLKNELDLINQFGGSNHSELLENILLEINEACKVTMSDTDDEQQKTSDDADTFANVEREFLFLKNRLGMQ